MDNNFCLVLIKPDAVRDGNIGKIIAEFENNLFEVTKIKNLFLTESMADSLYKEHRSRDGYSNLLSFMSDGMSVAMIVTHRSQNTIALANTIKGAVREKYATNETVCHNAIHVSDSVESALRESFIFF